MFFAGLSRRRLDTPRLRRYRSYCPIRGAHFCPLIWYAFYSLCRPNPELHTAMRIDPITQRDAHVQVVAGNLVSVDLTRRFAAPSPDWREGDPPSGRWPSGVTGRVLSHTPGNTYGGFQPLAC